MAIRVGCTVCHTPTTIRFNEALSFDTEWVLCEDCKPHVDRVPRVTLYGAPDGQELARWTDAPERSLSEHLASAGASAYPGRHRPSERT